MTIRAEGDTLERQVSLDPLDNDLVVDVVEDNVLVESNRAEEKLIERTEGDVFDTRLVSRCELVRLLACVSVIQSHYAIILPCTEEIPIQC